jgi:putative ABC transport system permease protein
MQTSTLITTFSGLAIFLACLGLLGLVAYAAERRTKEIGVRKVLGASVGGMMALLSKDLLQLVLIANLIAWPIVYYAANHWLQAFAYRIDIGILPFLLSTTLTVIIALATVSYQAHKAARANPIDALRNE